MGHTVSVPIADAVPKLDLSRYIGMWHEVSRYKFVWESICSSAEARYSLDSKTGEVEVTNTCFDAKHDVVMRRTGVATRTDASGKLRLRFTDGLPSDGESDYWVIMTDYDRYAVVGNPQKTQLWILSRTPSMSACLYRAIVEKLSSAFGYDTSKLELHVKAIAECIH